MIKNSRIGVVISLTLISLSSGVWFNRAIAQVGADQPIKNPGVSGITNPASSGEGGTTLDQPVTNPGVSGGNTPTPPLNQPNSTDGSQPVTNPGTSGINTPSLTQPATNPNTGNGGAAIDQPVTNPGVSGGNTPTPPLNQPNSTDGSQPVTNPGTSGINTPSLTQPNQPANPDTIRTIVAPNGVPDAIVQPRPNQPSLRTPQVTQPVPPQNTPTQVDNGTSTGFIRTAISSQLADNPNTQRLDAQLLQATCSQNWQGAIAIVDRVLGSAPTNQAYRSQLRTYRNRLETLSNARTVIPNWSQTCARG